MISGYTLMDYRDRYDTVTFFKKRILRAFVPFIVWSLIAYFVHLSLGHINKESMWGGVLGIINCKYFSIYWFFIPLFACYLSIPVLSLLPNKLKVFSYLFVYSFISYSLIPYLSALFQIQINPSIQNPIATQYILYILLGYILGHYNFSKLLRLLLYILGGIGIFLHCYMTIILSPQGSPISQLYLGYLNFPCVFYSAAVFTFFRYTNWEFIYKNSFFSYLFSKIREASLGVYLLHGWFVYNLVPWIGIDISSLTYRTAGACFIICLSVFCVLLLKKNTIYSKNSVV